jgi:hypothetical protein
MPTLSQIKLPVPKSWDEFEDIVVSAINSLQPVNVPQRFGRQGQAQDGIDIEFEDYMSRRTGVQCKNTDSISLPEIQAEIAKAEGYSPALESYVFAVSFPRDARIHKQVNKLSEDRFRRGKFRVGIWFWDDIAFFLSRDPTELARHFPQMFTSAAVPSAGQNSVQTGIASQQLKALQEMWALRHRIFPPKRHPDMEWDEALEDIAIDLAKHAKSLKDINQRLGSTLPQEVTILLESAEAAAVNGSFDMSLADDIEVPNAARKAAGRMFDLLSESIDKTRTSLATLGLKLD